MARYLVTGGAGFIGSHIVDALIERGDEVTVIDNLSTGKRENINLRARFIEMDIMDNLDIIFNVGRFDAVFHLAAQINIRRALADPRFDAKVNISGSLNVIDTAAKHKVGKFVFASTGGALYSPKASLPCNELSLKEPLSPYGLAKLTVESYLNLYKNLFGMDYVCLRFSNVYGPRQNPEGEAGVIAIFADKALKGEKLGVNGDGNQTRDYVYVKDVVNAALHSLNLSGEYNVSTEKETSVKELVGKIENIIGKKVEVVYRPAISGELFRSLLSSGKLRQEGWKHEYDIDRGIGEVVGAMLNVTRL
ncbi:MAG: NAD-dependent epimerase/dehydratase family protein [Nanoarchaeota archaeon]